MKNQEQDIIRRFKRGDESGLRLLFNLYYEPLCVYAHKYFNSIDQAEDIVQDVFISLWEKNRLINFTGSIKPYLFSIVRNNSINKIKQENRYRFEEIENKAFEIIEDKFESQEMEERKSKLYQEIDQLPEQCKKVFEAIIFEKMKYADVAEEMDISVNTIKTHYSRALKQLRGNLNIVFMIMMP